jgi:hypothetical protein
VGGNEGFHCLKNGELGIQEAKSLFFSLRLCSIPLLIYCLYRIRKRTNMLDCPPLFLFNALIMWYVFISDCKYACIMTIEH